MSAEVEPHGIEASASETTTQTHVPSPQLNPESYAGQLAWLGVTFAVLYFLLARDAIPRIERVLGHRKSRIDEDLDRAETLSAQADSARASVEKLDADALAESNRLIAEGVAAGKAASAERLSGLDRALAASLAEAETRLAAQREKIEHEIAPLAQKAADEIVEKILGRRSGVPTRAAS